MSEAAKKRHYIVVTSGTNQHGSFMVVYRNTHGGGAPAKKRVVIRDDYDLGPACATACAALVAALLVGPHDDAELVITGPEKGKARTILERLRRDPLKRSFLLPEDLHDLALAAMPGLIRCSFRNVAPPGRGPTIEAATRLLDFDDVKASRLMGLSMSLTSMLKDRVLTHQDAIEGETAYWATDASWLSPRMAAISWAPCTAEGILLGRAYTMDIRTLPGNTSDAEAVSCLAAFMFARTYWNQTPVIFNDSQGSAHLIRRHAHRSTGSPAIRDLIGLLKPVLDDVHIEWFPRLSTPAMKLADKAAKARNGGNNDFKQIKIGELMADYWKATKAA